MKTLAVTGANGFIGRHIVMEASRAGWSIRALVRDFKRDKPPNSVAFVPCELGSGPVSAKVLAGVDAICHAAAFIPEDSFDPSTAEKCMRVNALGTLQLLVAAREANVPRFINLSSGNAYRWSSEPVAEEAPIYPDNRAAYYLTSKLAAELYVAHWDRTGAISACTLRLSSVYGPGMNDKGPVALFSRRLLGRQPIVLKNGGNYGSDLVFVDDVAFAVVAALSAPIRGAVNIGSGKRTTMQVLAEELIAISGVDAGLVSVEPENSPPDRGFAALEITKAQRELRFRPTPLRDGLTRYLESLSSENALGR